MDEAKTRGIEPGQAREIVESPGQGVVGAVNGRRVAVGGWGFLTGRFSGIDAGLRRLLADDDRAELRAYVAVDGRAAGDRVRRRAAARARSIDGPAEGAGPPPGGTHLRRRPGEHRRDRPRDGHPGGARRPAARGQGGARRAPGVGGREGAHGGRRNQRCARADQRHGRHRARIGRRRDHRGGGGRGHPGGRPIQGSDRDRHQPPDHPHRAPEHLGGVGAERHRHGCRRLRLSAPHRRRTGAGGDRRGGHPQRAARQLPSGRRALNPSVGARPTRCRGVRTARYRTDGEVHPFERVAADHPLEPGVHPAPQLGIPIRTEPAADARRAHVDPPERQHDLPGRPGLGGAGDDVGAARWRRRTAHADASICGIAPRAEAEGDLAPPGVAGADELPFPIADQEAEIADPALDRHRAFRLRGLPSATGARGQERGQQPRARAHEAAESTARSRVSPRLALGGRSA